MKLETKATVHYCDGCGRERIQLPGADLPDGFYLDVIEIGRTGFYAGKLYACRKTCLTKAIERRGEVWNHP